ncbi:SMP-30/gluconolactonase/LRE family protein [Aestuariivita sp.]|jgi:sugar lactone lactonase YvrE|uniref:SMP-30/gluconolactonase/LRE family protein n=1 Tax=Aestuariivita sp. TaxID=1872407 RepID=UPI0025BD490F|nr:SMP-30/gluconolactonase/LRE family protein [Aestuariivita sp.]
MMRLLLAVLGLWAAYLIFWPVPVEPVAANLPEPPGAEGPFATNSALAGASFVPLPQGAVGPEDLALMPGGVIYTADLAGTLYRIDGAAPEPVAQLEGRPLGLDAGPDGRLYIADSFRGIFAWSPESGAEPIATEIDGGPILYANQLDVARDGTVFFSNSTDRFDPETMGGTRPTSVLTIWEQSATGYVGRIDPDGTVTRIADGFVYTNGVALSPDEDFLLIAETGRARIHRLWLSGARAGEQEILLDNLPGYPDNIEAMGDGTFWIAFASPRVPAEVLMPYPFLRKVIWRLGPMVRPAPIEQGHMIEIDMQGRVLRSLQDPDGRLGITTGGRVVGDLFYVMTLDSAGFGRMPVAGLPPRK